MVTNFPVSSSHLSADAIVAEVLPHFGLDIHSKCEFFSGGFNHTYRVRTEDGITYNDYIKLKMIICDLIQIRKLLWKPTPSLQQKNI